MKSSSNDNTDELSLRSVQKEKKNKLNQFFFVTVTKY